MVTGDTLIKKAKNLLVGGVNSPVRAFKYVGNKTLYVTRANGSYLYDNNMGKKYLDLITSYGAIFLGHNHPEVTKAITKQAKEGTSFGVTSIKELEYAHMLKQSCPELQKIRLVNSGTEACMTAVRLARGYTGRKTIVKFDGCYHGHSDMMLVQAGSGNLTYSTPSSNGVPKEISKYTISLPYNNPGFLEKYVKKNHKNIAAIIFEPVACNMGVIPANYEFLKAIKSTRKYGILIICDEVVTGFRYRYGLYQKSIGLRADITTIGKIIGGGFPLAALGGKKEIMDMLSPEGNVYQAGTLSGNPIAVTAGLEVLKKLNSKNIYKKLLNTSSYLSRELRNILAKFGFDYYFSWFNSCMTLFFTKNHVNNLEDALKSDRKAFSNFYWKFYKNGVLIPPSQFEAWFITPALTDKDVENLLKRFYNTVKTLKKTSI